MEVYVGDVVEEEVGCGVIYVGIDREGWRKWFWGFEVICGGLLKISEMEGVSSGDGG